MKRPKTLKSFFSAAPTPFVQPRSPNQPSVQVEHPETERVGVGIGNNIADAMQTEPVGIGVASSNSFSADEIVADPGLRRPIEEIDPNIRDDVRRGYISKGPCQPKGHDYPKRKIYNRNRSFHDEWFTDHPWLEYSIAKDAAFCFYCYLFKQPRADNYGVDAFTVIGFRGWKDGREIIDAHSTGIDHNKSRRDYEDYKNQRQSVQHAYNRGTKIAHEEQKGRLIIILGVVKFLMLQGLAFRGHDESSSSSNRENFLELIEWYKKKDTNAADLLRYNQMTSPDIQKEMCRACAELTTNAIISDIGDRHFSILVDEARDSSIKEQMDVVLRYVNPRGQVVERFLGLREVADTTSSSLKTALDGMFSSYGLSMSRLRGQGYDGASNMRGEFHGLQRRILDENPYAFYIHCFAHQLQLVVVSVAKCCSSVFDFFHTSTLIVNTVNASCKRRDQLAQAHHENLVSMLEKGDIFPGRGKNQQTNLARPGDTRWGSHHKTLCCIAQMCVAVLEVLENIADDASSGDKKYQALGLLKQMESFEFVLILHLMIRLLGMTNDLSQCLQRKDQNIVRAVRLIEATMQQVNEVREDGWEELFEQVKTFCVEHKIIIPDMEAQITVRGRSRGRGGQLVTYYHHFKYEIFNVVYDQIIVELNNRFNERSTQLLRRMACLDPKNSFASFDRDQLVELGKMYAVDFDHYGLTRLRDQLGLFIVDARSNPKFANCQDLGDLAITMVETEMNKDLRYVYRLVELALILPVATATVEKAFSAMKIIKTELRNKMGNDWLNHRMVYYIERDIFASMKDDDIVYHFQELKSRLKKLSPLPPTIASGSGSSPTVNQDT